MPTKSKKFLESYDSIFLNEDTREGLYDALKDFMKDSQDKVAAYNKHNFPSLEIPQLTTMDGPRYIRIVKETKVGRSSWAFIDKTNGDILKAAGWKAPAKGARANLFNKNSWHNIDAYGPAYLR